MTIPGEREAPRTRGTWELDSAEWASAGEGKRRMLLTTGWEPFAVSTGLVWFRRWRSREFEQGRNVQ